MSSTDPLDGRRAPVRGLIVSLRPKIGQAGGKYKVVSVTESKVKLQKGASTFIQIALSEFLEREVPTENFGPAEGVLRAVGYHVGRDGASQTERRTILDYVVGIPFDRLPAVENVSEWGDAFSDKRVQKIASCLSSFAQLERRKSKPNEQAIEEWEQDFWWFHKKYYDQAMRRSASLDD